AATAAAALRVTASRTGPAAPANSARATSALYAASPPRRSSAVAGGTPSAAGSSTSRRTEPPLTAHTVVVVVVVISSSPSSPRTTSAELPRPASTSAITGAIRASAHPTRPAAGCAGLVSG